MSDPIDRQAAIDVVSEGCQEWRGIFERCKEKLLSLPSAQPELSTEIQEILDYLDTTLHPIVSPDNWNVYSELHDMISSLLSSQPEIIRCEDCRWHKDQSGSTAWLPCRAIVTPSDFYCGRAERRTDDE